MFNVALVLVAYAGVRLYEINKQVQNEKRQGLENNSSVLEPQPVDELNGEQQATDISQPEEDAEALQEREKRKHRHYQKMSVVTLGTAALRMFAPSPITTLINIGAYTYTMFPFYRQVEVAVKDRLLKDRKVDSYLLMGLGNLMLLGTGRYFTAAVGLGMAYVGDAIQSKAVRTAQDELSTHLFDSVFDPNQKVWLVKDGSELEVKLGEVRKGDVLAIKAGETIAVDGEVIAGMASVDQHAFTGESYPVEKGVGESVYASTLMLTGQLQVRIEKSGHDTTIGRIGEILENSLQSKTQVQLRGEQWAEAANLPFLGLSALGFALKGANGAMVILSGNTVQAIRLLAPLATINYQAVASHKHILVKQGQALEQVGAIDTILFDKTGTLTDGDVKVSGLYSFDPAYTEDDLLYYAAMAEHKLSHPIARAILNHARDQGLSIDDLDDIECRLGFGIVAHFGGRTVHVGSARFMEAENISLSKKVIDKQSAIHMQGHSLVLIAIDSQLAGLIELEAILRPEVKQVFADLRERGIKHISIVSGDHAIPTKRLAEELGADSFHAEVLPEDKAGIVESFKSDGHTVCFIGDGVNDTIAMQKADLSISLRGATTLATDVAEIVLIEPNLNKLIELMDLSSQLERNLRRGLAVCYLGMGTVLAGSFFARMDILVATTIHLILGSSAIGNAMLPLLSIDRSASSSSSSDGDEDGNDRDNIKDNCNENQQISNSKEKCSESIDIAPSVESCSDDSAPAAQSHAQKTPSEDKDVEPEIGQPNPTKHKGANKTDNAQGQAKTLIVVGGGAAGIACALSAAEQGCAVTLIEKSGQLGGTVTQALIHTIGGLFDDAGEFINTGLPVELVKRLQNNCAYTQKRRIGKTWILNADPSIYAQVVRDWVAEHPNIDVKFHSIVDKVSSACDESGQSYIDQISITTDQHSYPVAAEAVIDTTGCADVARRFCSVSDGVAAAGVIVSLTDVEPDTVVFPKGLALIKRIRRAVEAGELPAVCASLWVDAGVYPDEVYLKFSARSTELDKEQLTQVVHTLLDFLRDCNGFAQAKIRQVGELGVRDAGLIHGEYTLTESDLKNGERFADAVCQACWPIEYWDEKKGVSLEYFPAGHRYDIPVRSLKVKGVNNLFIAGKCISAEPRAQASSRVAGTCWAMGEGLVKAIVAEQG